jgi:hypothetical protein
MAVYYSATNDVSGRWDRRLAGLKSDPTGETPVPPDKSGVAGY